MSMRSLESAIAAEARTLFQNPKLRIKDLQEWCTAQIEPQNGEVTARLPLNQVWVAVRCDADKRFLKATPKEPI